MTEDERLFYDKLCEFSAKDAGEIFALQERNKELEARLKTLEDLVARRVKHDDERIKHLEQELYSLSCQVIRMTVSIDDQSISEPRIREVEERQSRIRILEDPPGGIMGEPE